MKEKFKRFDDRYSVSDRGRVYDNQRNKIAKQWIDRRGLWTVTLHGQPKRTAMIVAAVWLDLRPGQIVFYRRGIDCHVNNLYTAKHRGRRRWNAKLSPAKARAIARSSESLATLAVRHGCGITCAWKVKHGLTWSHATGIETRKPK